ncbi:MAG: TonB-dependent receptor, partial [Kangiella sp.]|nr:TonB-dependent receptor [Kangiella sp.]
VGGSAGNSAGGGRDVTAAYFETLLPFTEDLEVSIAGRFDDYSDYGNDFSPKVSVRYQPMDELTLRASFGQGFRAPTLDILTQQTAFSADPVQDPQTCIVFGQPSNCEVQINAYRIANPDLESEQSDQYAFGLAYQPADWVNFTFDYYNIQVDNRIAFFSSQGLINREQAGDPIPAGLGVTRRANGSIAQILTGYGNEGDLETDGVDVNARFNFDFEDAGRLASNFQVSWINDLSIDGGRNLVRDPGTPQWRAVLQNVYNINDFTVAWNVNTIGGQYTDVVAVAGDDGVGRSGNMGVWTTHDLQVSYNTSWDGQISVGAQNVFEKYPTIEDFDGREYNYYLYNGYGRVAYVRYTQTF